MGTQGVPQELRPIQYSTPESWSTFQPMTEMMWLISPVSASS